jgi:hypothetical protein
MEDVARGEQGGVKAQLKRETSHGTVQSSSIEASRSARKSEEKIEKKKKSRKYYSTVQ